MGTGWFDRSFIPAQALSTFPYEPHAGLSPPDISGDGFSYGQPAARRLPGLFWGMRRKPIIGLQNPTFSGEVAPHFNELGERS